MCHFCACLPYVHDINAHMSQHFSVIRGKLCNSKLLLAGRWHLLHVQPSLQSEPGLLGVCVQY